MILNVELRQGSVLAMLFVDSIVIILNLKINYSQTIFFYVQFAPNRLKYFY